MKRRYKKMTTEQRSEHRQKRAESKECGASLWFSNLQGSGTLKTKQHRLACYAQEGGATYTKVLLGRTKRVVYVVSI